MISNEEISNRFDVLYNNIMSDQAPGLDDYEKSVFFNKAQLEVLKNHLNPKGNKYAEGFDFSSKRQLDFSTLIKSKTCYFPLNCKKSDYADNGWRITSSEGDYSYDDVLQIINESVMILSGDALSKYISVAEMLIAPQNVSLDFNNDGNVTIDDVAYLIDDIISNGPFASFGGKEQLVKILRDQLIPALSNGDTNANITLDSQYTIQRVVEELGVRGNVKVVVPINHVEYDTLSSRPYRYPPKSQAWRLMNNDTSEIITGPGEQPIFYKIRYIKVPTEVDLSGETNTCELPDFLIDEVLQRAVELAKNSWEGNSQTTVELGGRSE